MQRKRETLVVVRGGGDIATGTIQKLWNSGFGLVILETDRPTADPPEGGAFPGGLRGDCDGGGSHGGKNRKHG